ncbi:MAG: hypothetical protein AAF390_03490 [Pseudomonadota bacterium]
MVYRFLLALPFALALAAPAAATEELTVDQAASLVGTAVATADDVPLGKLIAVQTGPRGCALTIVKLHDRLEKQTSPLQVVGLQLGADGKLRVTDGSADLERTMGLPF